MISPTNGVTSFDVYAPNTVTSDRVADVLRRGNYSLRRVTIERPDLPPEVRDY